MTKGRWLGIAAIALLILLVWMWHSMDDSAATPQERAKPVADDSVALATGGNAAKKATLPAIKPVATTQTADQAPAPDKPKKLDPMGDEFFNKFIEEVPYQLSKRAVECYNDKIGSKTRNQKLVLSFTVRIKDGTVTVDNIRQKEARDTAHPTNTLNDPALESCFIQKIAAATWRDDTFPDYEWPDELVLNPERGLKKYWKSNVEYVGDVMPKK
jgi:hypothetical protein